MVNKKLNYLDLQLHIIEILLPDFENGINISQPKSFDELLKNTKAYLKLKHPTNSTKIQRNQLFEILKRLMNHGIIRTSLDSQPFYSKTYSLTEYALSNISKYHQPQTSHDNQRSTMQMLVELYKLSVSLVKTHVRQLPKNPTNKLHLLKAEHFEGFELDELSLKWWSMHANSFNILAIAILENLKNNIDFLISNYQTIEKPSINPLHQTSHSKDVQPKKKAIKV